MKFPLYDLSDVEFENIVASICEEILWIWTIVFSTWKDWWRDAKFHWTANNFPSASNPWSWKIVIQAKHTEKPNASCSDTGFNTIISKEIPKVIKLKQDWNIDFYIIFTNRKLTGWLSDSIETRITAETGVKCCLIGLERVLKFLNDTPKIIKRHDLYKLLLPLQFYEDDLVEIVKVFSDINFKDEKFKEDVNTIDEEIKKIPIETKNTLNNLSKDYFEDVLSRSYDYFSKIELFLKSPDNDVYKNMYEDTVAELRDVIAVNRNDYWAFEDILVYLSQYVIKSSWYFKNRRFITYFLHYMYYMCHIGKS